MADEKDPRHERVGPFRLGRKFDEVGPELGHLYASWHVATGQPAVTLRPSDRVYWLHQGPWRLGLSCEHGSPDVSLTVEQAPPFAPPTEVADLLVLMSAAFRRVEDSPRLHAHFAAGPVKPRRAGWGSRALVGTAVLVLGLGVWFHVTAGAPPPARSLPTGEVPLEAPSLINTGDASGQTIAYPPPRQPFRNQKKAPCNTRNQLEVEINGGCWVELAQRPPCADDRAEYEGKCYLPVAKEQGRPPQSAGP
ncbi:hypothetical protein CYFUS_004161 [Cystobacter fuscus]|uniref:Protein kinase n=1 Tax=Cystobacter fuscus TaxID=43 RepID=A0A250J6B6_9BACT|nr:hypothetical protein [Cystobacter fuscus]ATB38726.1 hypothetical protein CYFUS_004161 [Cystobacter fuscus]